MLVQTRQTQKTSLIAQDLEDYMQTRLVKPNAKFALLDHFALLHLHFHNPVTMEHIHFQVKSNAQSALQGMNAHHHYCQR